MNFKAVIELFKETFQDWSEDKAARLGAALAYYSVFSLAPLLLVIIAIAGMVLGDQANAREQIMNGIGGVVGKDAAQEIGTMIQGADKRGNSILATIIGVVTLLMGASGVFGQLQDALNTIWEVKPAPGGGILATLKARFLSLAMVLGTGFLLLVSLLLSTALHALGAWMSGVLPGPEIIMQAINFLLSFGVITLLFALIYKVLPDVEIQWRDVWIGAGMTALLFMIGQFALSWYLGNQSVGSVYGAAGSLVVLLLYIYYSAQIVFFGAEFTQVYSNKYGSHIEPSEGAIPVTEEMRAQQGLASAHDGAASGRKPEDRLHSGRKTGKHNRSASGNSAGSDSNGYSQPEAAPLEPQRAAIEQRNKESKENLADLGAVLAGFGVVALFKRWRRSGKEKSTKKR